MPLSCPSCGHHDFDPESQCECGYQEIEPTLIDPEVTASQDKYYEKIKEKTLTTLVKSRKNDSAESPVIKEMDSWIFTFSQEENCIFLGTPALQSFSLKLTVNDLEELLELIYQKTGSGKTVRKLELTANETRSIIDTVYRMIEEKKSKISIKLENQEMQEIADLINVTLKA